MDRVGFDLVVHHGEVVVDLQYDDVEVVLDGGVEVDVDCVERAGVGYVLVELFCFVWGGEEY